MRRSRPCSHRSVQRAFGDLLRVARASGHLGRALEIAGAAAEGPAWAGWVTVRLCALMTLAEISERLGDAPLVLSSIREGLAVWELSGLDREDPRLERFAAWEAWARERLRRAGAALQ